MDTMLIMMGITAAIAATTQQGHIVCSDNGNRVTMPILGIDRNISQHLVAAYPLGVAMVEIPTEK